MCQLRMKGRLEKIFKSSHHDIPCAPWPLPRQQRHPQITSTGHLSRCLSMDTEDRKCAMIVLFRNDKEKKRKRLVYNITITPCSPPLLAKQWHTISLWRVKRNEEGVLAVLLYNQEETALYNLTITMLLWPITPSSTKWCHLWVSGSTAMVYGYGCTWWQLVGVGETMKRDGWW